LHYLPLVGDDGKRGRGGKKGGEEKGGREEDFACFSMLRLNFVKPNPARRLTEKKEGGGKKRKRGEGEKRDTDTISPFSILSFRGRISTTAEGLRRGRRREREKRERGGPPTQLMTHFLSIDPLNDREGKGGRGERKKGEALTCHTITFLRKVSSGHWL